MCRLDPAQVHAVARGSEATNGRLESVEAAADLTGDFVEARIDSPYLNLSDAETKIARAWMR